jgi:hypothetical protein
MGFSITRDSLQSIQARRSVTGNSTGLRTIRSASVAVTTQYGFLSSIIRGIGSLAGFISNGLQTVLASIEFTATNILGWFKEGFDYLWEFNFQVTDNAIDKQIEGLFNSIQTRVFGILGKQIGSIVAIGIGGAIAFYINPVLARLLLTNVADDFFLQLINDIKGLLLLMAKQALTAGFLTLFKSTRSFIRKAYKNPQLRALSEKVGIDPKVIDQWGQKKDAEWSFAETKRQAIENIKDDQLQNFVEEFTEEFADGFWDTAFNMANVWDQLHLQSVERGSAQTLIYQPNRAVDSERIYLHGTPDQLQSQVVTINASRVLLDNRDIGNVITTEDDQAPTVGDGIKVIFKFINFSDRPYYSKERRKKVRRSRPEVPNCKRTAITWENIKNVLGTTGSPVFTDGDYWARCDLDNGKQLKCYANTEDEAIGLVEKLASFSHSNIIYPVDTGRKKGYSKSKRLKQGRDSQSMYLFEIEVINFDRMTKYQEIGDTAKAKNNTITKLKMDFNQKPSWWDADLARALSTTIS